MTNNLRFIITRHGKKENKRVAFSSPEDLALELSEEGKQEAFKYGSDNIEPDHDLVTTTTSTFLRAKQTAENMVAGAGYNPRLVSIVANPNLGHANVDFDHELFRPAMDTYAAEGEDAFVQSCLEGYHLPVEGEPSVLSGARCARDLLTAILYQTHMHQRAESEQGLSVVVTHGGFIDPLWAVLAGDISVDENDRVKLHDYDGAFKMGETIEGNVEDLETENPGFTFVAKNKVRAYDLKDMHLELEKHMDLCARYE